MKTSIIQFAPVLGNQKENNRLITRLIEQCCDSQLIVLPELANSGYRFFSYEEALSFSESLDSSQFIDILKNYTLKKQSVVVTGFNEKTPDGLYNSAILIEDGEIIGIYRKIHLFNDEKKYFIPGNKGLPVFKTKNGNIGMLVCFDWMFPEAWRILALQNADIICHPSNLVLPYAQHAVPTHAINNRVFIATANRIGSERDLIFTGESVIVSEKGKILARASTDKEEIIHAEIDLTLSHDKMITPGNHIFSDRRTDVYRQYEPFIGKAI